MKIIVVAALQNMKHYVKAAAANKVLITRQSSGLQNHTQIPARSSQLLSCEHVTVCSFRPYFHHHFPYNCLSYQQATTYVSLDVWNIYFSLFFSCLLKCLSFSVRVTMEWEALTFDPASSKLLFNHKVLERFSAKKLIATEEQTASGEAGRINWLPDISRSDSSIGLTFRCLVESSFTSQQEATFDLWYFQLSRICEGKVKNNLLNMHETYKPLFLKGQNKKINKKKTYLKTPSFCMYHLKQKKKKSKSTPLHFYYMCCFPAILCQTSGLLQYDYRGRESLFCCC